MRRVRRTYQGIQIPARAVTATMVPRMMPVNAIAEADEAGGWV
ncbi:MAG TPA: hypothetical protein VFB66_27395 [Tepidisphaeraceae bacterium]|nr:hypothetical protein [Tepidisphaeraceae bacterium]